MDELRKYLYEAEMMEFKINFWLKGIREGKLPDNSLVYDLRTNK